MYAVHPFKHFSNVDPELIFLHDKDYAYSTFQAGLGEAALVDWCRQTFANPDKVFLDVGAGAGSFSYSLAPHFRHVHAFEPHAELYNCLCANSLIRGLSEKITTYQVGVSDIIARRPYYVRSTSGQHNGFEHLGADRDEKTPTSHVWTRTLDIFNFENVGLIKITAEGHELSVLQGAEETLKNNGHPRILFESWSKQTQPELELRSDLFTYLHRIGYKIVTIRGLSDYFLAEKA